jgi:hypothetical protein
LANRVTIHNVENKFYFGPKAISLPPSPRLIIKLRFSPLGEKTKIHFQDALLVSILASSAFFAVALCQKPTGSHFPFQTGRHQLRP